MRYTEFVIGNEPRIWTAARFTEWRDGLPEKWELLAGQISGGNEEELLHMLAGLLEHIGADRAVQLGDPEVWRRAVAKLG